MSNSTVNTTLPAGEAGFNLYGYDPSKTAAYTYVGLFVVVGLAHFIVMFPFRAAFFIPLVLGCACEAGGYYFRSVSSDDTHKILPFVISSLLIMAAPPLLAATIYMTFGRIIKNLKGEDSSPISPQWLTFFFVMGDLVCLCSQLAGSMLRADTDPVINARGSHLILGGLILQVTIFAIFLLLAITFQIRYQKQEIMISLKWMRNMYVLYALSIVFVIRNTVRIVEFSQSSDGYINSHESMLYLFDATFMLFVVLLFLLVHPGRLFKAARRAEKIGGWRESNELTPFATK